MRGAAGTRGASDYRMDRLVLDVTQVAEALGWAQFHLVGHSLGGAIALEVARAHPAQVLGLHLVSPPPGDALEAMSAQANYTGWVLRQFDPQRPLDRWTLLSMLQLGKSWGTSRWYFEARLKAFMPHASLSSATFAALLEDAVAMEPRAVLGIYRDPRPVGRPRSLGSARCRSACCRARTMCWCRRRRWRT